MTERFQAQIETVLKGMCVESSTCFTWFGAPYRRSGDEVDGSLGNDDRWDLLVASLRDHLYRHFFGSGGAVSRPAGWDAPSPDRLGGTFASRLEEANAGRGFPETGWCVDKVDGGRAVLSKEGLTVVAPLEECLVGTGGRVARGDRVSLRRAGGSFRASPGFYVAYGDEVLQGGGGEDRALARIYWNVQPGGAVALVEVVTRRLNESGMPFQLKVLDDPAAYARSDSAVLYLAKASYARFRALHAKAVLAATAGGLTEGVPALTKPVARGVSVAEDPREPQSFGAHRCGVLARAIIAGARQDATTAQRRALVGEHFERSGIRPGRPYLEIGSADVFEPLEQPEPCVVGPLRRRQGPGRRSGMGRISSAAGEIGSLLVRRAVWHEDRCSWMGALGSPADRPGAARFGAVGTDLYDGTAGIALFLGELYRTSGDGDVGRTALGAVRHALRRGADDPDGRVGLYVGSLGTAVAAVRIGTLLDDDHLVSEGSRLAGAAAPEVGGFDLMSGAAGSIVGYLVLRRTCGDDRYLDFAVAAGRRLLESAERSGRGVSWGPEQRPRRSNLTGLSHGAAGAAYALLELYAVTGKREFRRAAEAAFDYERSWFDPEKGNWPDLRQVAPGPGSRATSLPFSTTWCHGAPGIAVSRIRAAELLPDARYRAEASRALTTTRDHLLGWQRSGRANWSLCHGLAGNADVLLTALRSEADLACDVEDAIRETARRGLERDVAGAAWPCGVPGGGPSPSLMLGWAGIGIFYLRLADPDTPSPLAPLG